MFRTVKFPPIITSPLVLKVAAVIPAPTAKLLKLPLVAEMALKEVLLR